MLVELFNNKGYYADLDNGIIYGTRGQKLIPCKTYNGYYTVTVNNKRQKIHRLILTTATHSNGEGLQVNHKDGNKANNKLSNLEWASAKENTHHAEITGLRTHIQTKVRKDRKLTDDEVRLIRYYSSLGWNTKQIKEICPKANPKNIYAIKNNLSYKAVKDNTEVS